MKQTLLWLLGVSAAAVALMFILVGGEGTKMTVSVTQTGKEVARVAPTRSVSATPITAETAPEKSARLAPALSEQQEALQRPAETSEPKERTPSAVSATSSPVTATYHVDLTKLYAVNVQ